MFYTAKISSAIKFANNVHKGQTRKGKPNEPYISHPLSVGLILSRASASEDIITAGILHDTIEDCDPWGSVTQKIIEIEFNKEIARMVNDVTEQDKTLSWKVRKQLALDHVKSMKKDSVMVKSADVLNNLTDQIKDFEELGDSMFERFHADKFLQLERYQKLFVEIKKAHPKNPLLLELDEAVNTATKLWS